MFDWKHLLCVEVVLASICAVLMTYFSTSVAWSFLIGAAVMLLAQGIGAMRHFAFSHECAKTILRQCYMGTVYKLGMLLLCTGLLLRYELVGYWWAYFVGVLLMQQTQWLVPFWKTYKGIKVDE